MDEPTEPPLVKQAISEMTAEAEPQEIAAKNTHIGSDQYGDERHGALAHEDSRRNIDCFFTNRDSYARGEQQNNHGQWAIVAEELSEWTEIIHEVDSKTSEEKRTSQCIVRLISSLA